MVNELNGIYTQTKLIYELLETLIKSHFILVGNNYMKESLYFLSHKIVE
jgi:hypothetical protein